MRRLLAAFTAAATVLGTAALSTVAGEIAAPRTALALDDGLALTPPMGFNDWNSFGCDVDENLIVQTADLIASNGMKEAGYDFVNVDDCWAAPDRDALTGRLQAHPTKFPHGIRWLADYVHGKGLKFGIYTSAGTQTCARTMPGGLDHEDIDAQTFADWGVDYLKYDNCNNQNRPALERYPRMRDALAKTGRPIVYSITEWGQNQPWLWGADVGHLWRTTGDIGDNWSSVRSIIRQNLPLFPFAGPGHWNDPDMLEVARGGMTDTEYRTHFGMWAIMAAPLLVGSDLRRATPSTMDILLNKEVIAIDQDPLGVQGRPIRDQNGLVVLRKPLADGDTAVALYNETDRATPISTTAAELGLPPRPAYTVRDVWRHQTTETAGQLSAFVPAHGHALYRVSTDPRWAAFPPSSTLSVSTPSPFPNATISVVKPGMANPVSTAFTNLGRLPVPRVQVRMTGPDGWSVRATSPTLRPVVGSGQSFGTTWTVTPPADAAPGKYLLTGTASFRWTSVSTVDFITEVFVPPPAPTGVRFLSDVPWMSIVNGWGPAELDRSNGEQGTHDGNPMTIGGVVYPKGIGAHADSEILYYTGGQCRSVTSDIGIDDEKTGNGDATWQIWADDRVVAEDKATWQDAPKHLTADVAGATFVRLITLTNGDANSDHTDWAGLQITCTG